MVRAAVVLAALAALLAALIPSSSWGTPGGYTIEHVSNGREESSLELDSYGNPNIAARHQDRLSVYRCASPDCQSNPGGYGLTIPTAGAHFAVIDDISLALTANDEPVVSFNFVDHSFFEPPNEHGLAIGFCSPLPCEEMTWNLVDSGTNVGLYNSIALDANEFPVVSYFDDTTDNLKVLHCGDATCSAGNSLVMPDIAGSVGKYTSLELDGSGNPVVSYFDESEATLKVLHCGNPNCTSGNTIATPDTTPNVGMFTSLELDSMGRPVVSYHDAGNSDLRLLRCGDQTCSSGNSITSPETAGSVGLETSLALDANDNPVIAHREAFFGGHLRLVICGDATCSAGNLAFPMGGEGTGATPSLALDASNAPVVSYYYQSIGAQLFLLHCGSSTCLAQDSDSDGCLDQIEMDTGVDTQLRGGRRNPKNPSDYFNPTGDGQNRIDDVLAVVGQYFEDAFLDPPTNSVPNPDYSAGTDRTDDPGSSEAWDLLGPNGQQRIDDILAVVYQYFHDCG